MAETFQDVRCNEQERAEAFGRFLREDQSELKGAPPWMYMMALARFLGSKLAPAADANHVASEAALRLFQGRSVPAQGLLRAWLASAVRTCLFEIAPKVQIDIPADLYCERLDSDWVTRILSDIWDRMSETDESKKEDPPRPAGKSRRRSLAELEKDLIPIPTQKDIEDIQLLVEAAQVVDPPEGRERFVSAMRRIFEANGLAIRTEDGKLARLTMKDGGIQLAFRSAADGTRGFKNAGKLQVIAELHSIPDPSLP